VQDDPARRLHRRFAYLIDETPLGCSRLPRADHPPFAGVLTAFLFPWKPLPPYDHKSRGRCSSMEGDQFLLSYLLYSFPHRSSPSFPTACRWFSPKYQVALLSTPRGRCLRVSCAPAPLFQVSSPLFAQLLTRRTSPCIPDGPSQIPP